MDEYQENEWRKLPIVIKARRMRERFVTQTMEGELAGKPGDWLLTGVRGEQYPCDDGVFRQTYEQATAPVEPAGLPEGWMWDKENRMRAETLPFGDEVLAEHYCTIYERGGAMYCDGAPVPVVLAVLVRAGVIPAVTELTAMEAAAARGMVSTPALTPEQTRDTAEWRRRERHDGDPDWYGRLGPMRLSVGVACEWCFDWTVVGGDGDIEHATGEVYIADAEDRGEDWNYQHVERAQARCEAVATAILRTLGEPGKEPA